MIDVSPERDRLLEAKIAAEVAVTDAEDVWDAANNALKVYDDRVVRDKQSRLDELMHRRNG